MGCYLSKEKLWHRAIAWTLQPDQMRKGLRGMWVKLQSQRASLCSSVWSPQAAARCRMWPRVGQYQGGEEQFSRCPGQETLGALHRPHYPLAATHHFSAERCPAAEWHQCSMYTKPESTSRLQLAASYSLCRTRNSQKGRWGFVSLSFLKCFLQIYFYTNYLFQQAGIPSDKIPYVTIGTGACECITALTCVSICGFFAFVMVQAMHPIMMKCSLW